MASDSFQNTLVGYGDSAAPTAFYKRRLSFRTAHRLSSASPAKRNMQPSGLRCKRAMSRCEMGLIDYLPDHGEPCTAFATTHSHWDTDKLYQALTHGYRYQKGRVTARHLLYWSRKKSVLRERGKGTEATAECTSVSKHRMYCRSSVQVVLNVAHLSLLHSCHSVQQHAYLQ